MILGQHVSHWTIAGTRATILSDDMSQLDSNSLFITTSNANTFLISNANDAISFPLSSMNEPLIVQALPLADVSYTLLFNLALICCLNIYDLNVCLGKSIVNPCYSRNMCL